MHRRHFLTLLAGLSGTACAAKPVLFNPCLSARLPAGLANHDLVRQAFADLRPDHIWDGHVHLLGLGDGQTGAWVNPDLQSLRHPLQYTQLRFYLNASCVDKDRADASFIDRLLALKQGFPAGSRFMLLAFDYTYDEAGHRRLDRSAFHTPNDWAARGHRENPEDFEWIASIHPYRVDAVEALDSAHKNGARAVKWLPPAMGIDPGAARCDDFYAALVRTGIPLLTHAGDEQAVHGSGRQEFGNPLLLRRPLDHGVKVIVAHCASLGRGRDLDKGVEGPLQSNFSLFARLMDETRYEGKLFGEISAVTQRNRDGAVLKTLLETQAWHPRLVNGSDYPLPGVIPLISPGKLRRQGFLDAAAVRVLEQVRQHNAILFDFMLKRLLRSGNNSFSPGIFEGRRVYGQSSRVI